MDLTETELNAMLGGLIIGGLLVAYPAILTAVAYVRAERTLGELFWHVVNAFDRRPRH